MVLSSGAKDAQAGNGKPATLSELYAPYRVRASETLALHRKTEPILSKFLRGAIGPTRDEESKAFQSMLRALKAVDNNVGAEAAQKAAEVIALYDVPSGKYMARTSEAICGIATNNPKILIEALGVLESFAKDRRFEEGTAEAERRAEIASNNLPLVIELRNYEKAKNERAVERTKTDPKPETPTMYN